MSFVERYLAGLEAFLIKNRAPKENIWWFATATYSLLFAKLILLWLNVYQFYDVTEKTVIANASNPINWFTKTVLFLDSPNLNLVMVISLCVVIIAVAYRSFITSFLALIICLNHNTLVLKAINGGDFALTFFCFILLFVNTRRKLSNNRNLLANAFWLLLKINFCYLYFVNAYGKVIKKIWLNGDAILQSWNLDYFANHNLIPSFFYNRTICMLTGWSVIIFEFVFAFLIWYQDSKKSLLIIGVLFHLGIGIFLSLPDFALTMLVGYIPFLEPKWLSKKKAAQPLEPL